MTTKTIAVDFLNLSFLFSLKAYLQEGTAFIFWGEGQEGEILKCS